MCTADPKASINEPWLAVGRLRHIPIVWSKDRVHKRGMMIEYDVVLFAL